MAKLHRLPSQAIINGFKGVIDFYMNYQACDRSIAGPGIPCARSWPRSPGHDRAPLVEARWPAFAWSAANWNSLDPYVQEAYRRTASESTLTGRDLFTKSFITDYFRQGQWDTLSKDPVFTPEECEMKPACSVYLSADFLNIPNNIDTLLPFDTEDYDTCDNFDCVNHRFVCPIDGRYFVSLSVLWFNVPVEHYFYAYIFKNGVATRASLIWFPIAGWQAQNVSHIINCLAGDILTAWVMQTTGQATADIYGSNTPLYTSMSISLLDQP